MLVRVLVDGRHRRIREVALFHVADDPNHLLQRCFRLERQRHPPSDRIGVAPQELRGAAADEHHVGVGFRHVPPADQRYTHCLQVPGQDLPHGHGRLVAWQELRFSLVHDWLHRAALDRQAVDRRGGLDAWQRQDALQRRGEERGRLCGRFVPRFRQPDVHGQHVARVEASIHASQRDEAAEHDAGAHQQHHR